MIGWLPAWLAWAFALAFVLHNAEEALRIEAWARERLSPAKARRYRTAPFVLAVSLLSSSYLGIVVWAVVSGSGIAAWVVTFACAAIVANAVVHLVASLASRRVVPGSVTAVGLILPLGAYAARLALDSAVVSGRELLLVLLAGAVLQVPAAFVAIAAGNGLAAIPARRARGRASR